MYFILFFFLCADDSDRSSSKAATVEMYSYANSNNGTVTGETLSSISEKSEQYSDEHSVDDYPVSSILNIVNHNQHWTADLLSTLQLVVLVKDAWFH